jgi:hypothetical protein
MAVRIECIDEAIPLTCDIIVLGGILLGIGDE